MLKPEEMTRAVVVGSMDSLDTTIECLYELGLLHLIDFTEQDEDFRIGQPLPKASVASQKLLKLRSMIRSLEIEGHKPPEPLPVSEINQRLEQALVTLDLNTSNKAESRQKIQSLIREKESEIRAIESVAGLPIPLEDYEGYENISVFVGVCESDPETALASEIQDFEIYKEVRKSDATVALFVRNDAKAKAAKALSEFGFQEIKLPKLKGSPEALLADLRKQVADFEADLHRIEADLEKVRKQFADFIISSEEHLAIEVLKAETPLRIATTANSFVIDGWIPTARVGEIQTALDSLCCGRAFVETIPMEKEEPPTKLRNSKLIRPFEMFISMVSTPKYEEIDPTIMLFITFPLFFGLMIGDLGFGAGLTIVGAIIMAKMKGSPDFWKLGAIIFAGGLVASVFGLFIFAEAFGVPFHPPEESPDEASWESLANIPIHPAIDKMHDVNELLAISMLAGWAHLTVGLVFGFFNVRHHSIKHALAKVAWMLILLGLFEETMTIAGDATMTSEFVNATVFGLFPTSTFEIAAIEISTAAIVLIIIGVIVLPLTEGPFALTEVTGIFTNLLSYARLAALAVGKGGMALAFNTMLFPMIFDSSNLAIAACGVVLLVITQLFFVFFLGALSAGIQAIRLNYVEFFLKFFEGGGTEFSPLKYIRKHSVATK